MKASFKLPENNIKASFSIPAGGGGTYDYERLRNKPSINEVELIGNKTSEELGLASIGDIPTLQDLVTPEQLEAINSGATSTNIAKISTNAGNIILINNTVSDLSSTVQSNYTILDNKIDTTQTTLQGNINALSGTVTSNYNDLTQSITNNVSTLNTRITNEVSTLNGSITNEATTRQNADNNLQSQIDAITSASDVFDIVGTYAELQAYDISIVPVNDIIKVLVDSTHNNSATYYRCIETAEVKSWNYIGSEGAYYTKSEADGLFVKQTTTINNKPLSNNITLTASDVGALPSDTQIGNGTVTINQGGTQKGTFTLNQSGNTTINLDAGGGTPSNMMTTDTAQDVSGRKTFLGEKAIYFKQQTTSNKLGFTLYDPNNVELGALEYRPNTISGSALLALNCPQTTGSYVGFRYWGTPAVNIVAPKVATAGNYFIPTHITNGNTTVTSNNVGTVNISTLIPTIATSVSSSSTNAQTVGAKLFYDTVGNIETLLSNV